MLNPLIPTSPLSLGHRQLRRPRGQPAVRRHQPVAASLERTETERRWKDQVDRRYAGAFQESNRRLAELTGLDLAALGYDLD